MVISGWTKFVLFAVGGILMFILGSSGKRVPFDLKSPLSAMDDVTRLGCKVSGAILIILALQSLGKMLHLL